MKSRISAIVIIFILVILGACALWWTAPMFIKSPREEAQKQLANELGVRIEDYPSPDAFPSGYFSTVLKPGMTIEDVHKIVRGYKIAVHCDTYAEVYYYFSTNYDDEMMERFKLFYDDNGRYEDLMTEDSDSSTISTEGCVPGLMEDLSSYP